jgi:ubiquinone/menaquinone biosynthesis C-methylase UbiE
MTQIDLSGLTLEGRVLDIGGGGEGFISRRVGGSVVAIDLRADELAETADIGLKVIMDATDLKFLDGYFDIVTCFYSLMYMDVPTKAKCIREAYRVLKPGGGLYIWDAVIPARLAGGTFITELAVTVNPGTETTVGYGVGHAAEQNANMIRDLCVDAGFVPVSEDEGKEAFRMRFLTPSSNQPYNSPSGSPRPRGASLCPFR